MTWKVLGAYFLGMFIVLSSLGIQKVAAGGPKFRVETGKVYLTTHSCLPQVGCFAEVVHVIAVDGKWFQVDGGFWVNTEALTGVREITLEELQKMAEPSAAPAPKTPKGTLRAEL
jgi:hypothetical protein